MRPLDERWKWMKDELQALTSQSQYRELIATSSDPSEPGWLIRDGRKMLNLASNHYLGIGQQFYGGNMELATIGMETRIDELRIGATASRLIVGSDPIFQQFEREFAAYKGTQSSLLFSNGYMANLGVISSLMGRGDHIFSDRLNHASIVDGVTLSRAEHHRYAHRDTEQLAWMLAKVPRDSKKLIVTDALFSMDGTFAPLLQLVELKHKYQAMLFVDEAHSGGVYGEAGKGYTHALGLTDEVDIQMGTFSKAYGCYGAYIATHELVTNYIVNKARSFIYTTALPPIVVGMIIHNWQQVQRADERRIHVQDIATSFRTQLQSLGISVGQSESHIVPVMVGSNEQTIAFARKLQELGIAAVAIRPPTVPEGTGRIRFTLTADHSQQDIDWAVRHIGQVARELQLRD
jgi:8-amino-7-oxononanoate synthase